MLLLSNVDGKLRVRYLRLLIIGHQCLFRNFDLATKKFGEMGSLERQVLGVFPLLLGARSSG
jgi:hypothetical protein